MLYIKFASVSNKDCSHNVYYIVNMFSAKGYTAISLFITVQFMNVLRIQFALFRSYEVFIEVLWTISRDNEAVPSVNWLIIVN
jgi:hypothetical protein